MLPFHAFGHSFQDPLPPNMSRYSIIISSQNMQVFMSTFLDRIPIRLARRLKEVDRREEE